MPSTALALSAFNDGAPDLSSVDATSYEKLYGETVKLFDTKLNQSANVEKPYTKNIKHLILNDLSRTWSLYSNAAHIDFPNLHRVSRPKVWTKFHTLQEWEGYILDVSENEFAARLLDLTADANEEDEEVTVPLSEIAETDHKHLYSGSIFRWVIGHEYSERGTLRRVSEIIFRDLPVMSGSDRSDGQKWAKEIAESLNY